MSKRNLKNKNTPSPLAPAITEMVKIFRKYNMDYYQTQYVVREARKTLGIKQPKSTNKGTVKRMSKEQLDLFLKTAFDFGAHIGLMMSTLYETAARVEEFVNLEADDIYSKELRIVIKDGKGSKRREVPITENLRQALLIHLKGREQGYIFYSRNNRRYSTRRIQQLVGQIAKAANISMNVTPHTLRHTRATLLAEGGMSKDLLQLFLGHEKPETTEIYTKTAALNMQEGFNSATSKA